MEAYVEPGPHTAAEVQYGLLTCLMNQSGHQSAPTQHNRTVSVAGANSYRARELLGHV